MSVIIGRALPDVRDGLKPVHRRVLYAMFREGLAVVSRLLEVRRHRRRGAEEVPPPRRLRGLRHPRADGPGLQPEGAAHRRPGKLRLGRRRSAGGLPLHRGPPHAARREHDAGHRQGHGRVRRELRRQHDRAHGAADRDPEPARQRRGRESRSAWRRTSRPTTCARSSTASCSSSTTRRNRGRRAHREAHRASFPDPTSRRPPSCTVAGASSRPIPDGARHDPAPRPRRDRGRSARTGEAIIVSEIPYQVNKARLQEKIAELVRDRRIDGISDIRDESDRRGMRIVIDAQARRGRPGRAEQPLQAHRAPDELRHHPARDRRQPPQGAVASSELIRPVHRLPARRRAPANELSSSARPKSAPTSSRASSSPSTTSTRSSPSSADPRTPAVARERTHDRATA